MNKRDFALGVIAGGLIFAAGFTLGGAGDTPIAFAAERAAINTLEVRRLHLVGAGGQTLAALRPGREGATLELRDFDEQLRAQLDASGRLDVYNQLGRPMARLGPADASAQWSDALTGELLLFDHVGTVMGRMPTWSSPALPETIAFPEPALSRR